MMDLELPRAVLMMREKALRAGWEAITVPGSGAIEARRKRDGHMEMTLVEFQSLSLRLRRAGEGEKTKLMELSLFR